MPLIINWVSKFGKESIPGKILKVNQTLKILHIVCDEVYKGVKKISKFTQCQNIEEYFFYYITKKFPNILTQLILFKLKRNCTFYKISIHNFQKIFLEIKKNYPYDQKIFWPNTKKNLLRYKNILLSDKILV